MADSRVDDTEAKFRAVLEEAYDAVERLSPHCRTVEELLDVLALALKNDGQLRLLLKEMTAPTQGRR